MSCILTHPFARTIRRTILGLAVAGTVSSAAAGTPLQPTIPPQLTSQSTAPLEPIPVPVQSAESIRQTGYALGTTLGLPAMQPGSALPSVPAPGYGPVIPNKRPVSPAPLYPAPVQYTPPQNGGTIVTNQAFAPHEMMYAHRYRAMYGPYFYEVKGRTLWTPLGLRTFENWKLRGTEVDVKYHDHISPFAGFIPPR